MNPSEQMPLQQRKAQIGGIARNQEGGTIDVEVVWSTGAAVRRYDYANREYYYEVLVMEPSAIRMERLTSGSAPVLNSHSSYSLESVIGAVRGETARIEGGQGIATLNVDASGENESIARKIENKIIRNVSVGYVVHQREIIRREGDVPVYQITDWEPYEISFVPIGADAGAGVRAAETLFPCETINRSAPAPSTTIEETMSNPNTTTVASSGVAQPQSPAVAAVNEQQIASEARSAELVRIQSIRALMTQTRTSHPSLDKNLAEIENDAIAKGETIDGVRAKVLDALTSQQENITTTVRMGEEDNQKMGRAIESAILHRYDPTKFKLEGGGEDFRGMALAEIGREVLSHQGVKVRGLSRSELAGLMLQRAGSHTTSDFPAILANVANKTVRIAYEAAPRTFTAWARQVTAPDFKINSRTQLSDAPALEKVNENGEFKSGSFSDQKEEYALASYGKIVPITRQAIINDDQSVFTRVPAAMATSAAALESDIVYNILKNNPNLADGVALFHATHKNLGTGGAISVTTLNELRRLARTQTGPNGTILNLQLAYLIVPAAREAEGQSFLANTQILAGKAADYNPFAGSMQLIVEPRLDGVAQNPWYAAAANGAIDTIEYCYLEGQVGAYIETKIGFDVDGIQIKVRNDFAAAPIDHRGLVKNPGV